MRATPPPSRPNPQKKQSPVTIIALIVAAIAIFGGLYSALQPSDLSQQWGSAADQAREAAEASRKANQL